LSEFFTPPEVLSLPGAHKGPRRSHRGRILQNQTHNEPGGFYDRDAQILPAEDIANYLR
jgi:hypothetical protein